MSVWNLFPVESIYPFHSLFIFISFSLFSFLFIQFYSIITSYSSQYTLHCTQIVMIKRKWITLISSLLSPPHIPSMFNSQSLFTLIFRFNTLQSHSSLWIIYRDWGLCYSTDYWIMNKEGWIRIGSTTIHSQSVDITLLSHFINHPLLIVTSNITLIIIYSPFPFSSDFNSLDITIIISSHEIWCNSHNC